MTKTGGKRGGRRERRKARREESPGVAGHEGWRDLGRKRKDRGGEHGRKRERRRKKWKNSGMTDRERESGESGGKCYSIIIIIIVIVMRIINQTGTADAGTRSFFGFQNRSLN